MGLIQVKVVKEKETSQQKETSRPRPRARLLLLLLDQRSTTDQSLASALPPITTSPDLRGMV